MLIQVWNLVFQRTKKDPWFDCFTAKKNPKKDWDNNNISMSWKIIQTDVWGILYSLFGGGVLYVEYLEKGEEGTLINAIGREKSHEWKTFLEGDFSPAQEH